MATGYRASSPEDLEALRGYGRIEGDLEITGNVVDLSPLSCLTTVNGNLTLRALAIASVEGLSGLRSVGALDIEQCSALSSLAGLEALQHVDSLSLFDNPTLSDLEALANVALQGDISIVNNPEIATLTGLRSTSALRSAWVGGASLENLHGLEQLARVDDLVLEVMPGLRDLTGLDGVRSIASLRLLDNPNLESLEGLGPIQALDELYLSVDPKLANIDALSKLSSLGELYLSNVGLVDLSPLNGVSQLTALDINECSVLSSLLGLDRVAMISGGLSIRQNPALASLHGLEALESASRLTITENQVLPTCEADRVRDRLNDASLELVEIADNDDAGVCL